MVLALNSPFIISAVTLLVILIFVLGFLAGVVYYIHFGG